jgi:hypothetical protein
MGTQILDQELMTYHYQTMAELAETQFSHNCYPCRITVHAELSVE